MIEVSVQIAPDVVTAYLEVIPKFPSLLRKAFRGEVDRIGKKYLIRLRTEPGRPRYPLRWKSERQRRYVMAKLRREKNLPYRRTHRLSRGWKIQMVKNEIIAKNETPYAVFVQGDYAQPFHLDTGWPQAAPILVDLEVEMNDALIETWYAITTGTKNL